MYRAYTANASLSATQYLTASKFKIGINGATPTIADTNLTYPVPISNGTVCDNGSNQLTGSSGGDNTTDNTTSYKEGAGETDNTSQNLIANNGNATKIWTLSSLTANAVSTKPFGLWIYIKDAAALAKIVSLTIKIGSDSSNYYYQTTAVANLAVGWNWITSNTANVSTLSTTGTPGSPLDTFIIEIVTNNATDTFVAGDVLYDLFRQWDTTDLIKSFTTGYPTLDLTNFEATTRCYLSSLEANGFLIDSVGLFNQDTSPLMTSTDNYGGDSKSSTDEFAFVIKDRVI